MSEKTIAIIDRKSYQVGYPQCAGCENLCPLAPATCLYQGDGCEYPAQRIKSEVDNDPKTNR